MAQDAQMAQHTQAQHHTPEEMRRSYLFGFALAIILTMIPFGVVAFGLVSKPAAIFIIAGTAIFQVFVHLRFFLHMKPGLMPRENFMAIGFAAVLILIMIGGTLWIMLDLHYRMMI